MANIQKCEDISFAPPPIQATKQPTREMASKLEIGIGAKNYLLGGEKANTKLSPRQAEVFRIDFRASY